MGLVARGAEQQGTWKMRHALHAQRCGNEENASAGDEQQKLGKTRRRFIVRQLSLIATKKSVGDFIF
jgi:hypothetical protein